MKAILMIQSLSPLAILTIIRNSEFVCTDECGQTLGIERFLCANWVLLAVMTVCIVWIAAASAGFFALGAFSFRDKKTGYELKEWEEQEDASLNFFMTLIIPLLIDEVNTIQGAVTFFVIVAMMCVLLWKTKLFYANPVLAMIGYRVYQCSFIDNQEVGSRQCVGLCKEKLTSGRNLEYKVISDNVVYIKKRKVKAQ